MAKLFILMGLLSLSATSAFAEESCGKIMKIDGFTSSKFTVTVKGGEKISAMGDKEDIAILVAAQGTNQTVCFKPGNVNVEEFWLSSIAK